MVRQACQIKCCVVIPIPEGSRKDDGSDGFFFVVFVVIAILFAKFLYIREQWFEIPSLRTARLCCRTYKEYSDRTFTLGSFLITQPGGAPEFQQPKRFSQKGTFSQRQSQWLN